MAPLRASKGFACHVFTTVDVRFARSRFHGCPLVDGVNRKWTVRQRVLNPPLLLSADYKDVALSAPAGTSRANFARQEESNAKRPEKSVLRVMCFRLGVGGQRPDLAEPAQSDWSAESADDYAIYFSQQYAGQDHEAGRDDARVQVQLPADEGRSLVWRDRDSCRGYILFFVFNREG